MATFAKEEVEVVIVGAGPAGLAVSACLNKLAIKNVVLEKEDCCGYLWKKRTYDRLHLHLSKDFCSLPLKPHANSAPKYLSKNEFIQYLDEYVENFNINPKFQCCVEMAFYEKEEKKWNIKVRNVATGEMEFYGCDFLVLASGENNEGYIPKVLGLEKFKGEIIHSSEYKSGQKYEGKEVLVVGSGNSGMEIAFDLSNYRSCASIVVRNPIHVLTREMVHTGMLLLKYLPISLVDTLIAKCAKIRFGNLAELGIPQPEEGPFYIKISKGRSPVIDVGAIDKIKLGEIKVLPGISKIKEHTVEFDNGEEHQFDAIIFATGYKNAATKWLKDHSSIFLDDGTLINEFPNHWKGENGLYCAGFSKRGLFGISMDAKSIVDNINIVIGKKI
ncbi:putative indole-3-pyruvate monooxygenase YUCCA10 [Nicotiana tabacum]|uniref:Flavin-containing monooxygenase n=1 Tax=Nicotiana tabacum TaxID=4097 RepID=A0A1S3YRU4_TOBAC|nr:probable indole-3-pyruvate monooxygenase YUCCA10 [Nicotiana tomentosiformis]XP_016454959.1 PREDICTED: probable indole-3-pyruvate monooxygenase YUCCA10 [Nicotiana tabacum]